MSRYLEPEQYTIRLPILRTPDPAPASECLGNAQPNGLRCVTSASPLADRKAVWQMAVYFQREFGFDTVLYGAGGRDTDPEARAYLWTSETRVRETGASLVTGACCFRWREWTDGQGWALQWVWMHPYERGQGRLSEAWPFFRTYFGTFLVEGPHSPGMKAFLRKMDLSP